MSIKNTARRNGAMRDPGLRIPAVPDGEQIGPRVHAIVDAGQNPEHVPLHDLGTAGKRRCTAGPDGDKPCALCAAEVPVRHNWIARVDEIVTGGLIAPRSLWLSKRELGDLASVLPDSGTVEIAIWRENEPEKEDGKKKTTRRDGKPWTVTIFEVVKDGNGDDDSDDD